MTQPRHDDVMVARLAPGAQGSPPEAGPSGGRDFLIEIPAADGTPLLRMTERGGRLCVEGDETRWDEGAKRFLHAMMQWSGLVGIRWKDEVIQAVEGAPE